MADFQDIQQQLLDDQATVPEPQAPVRSAKFEEMKERIIKLKSEGRADEIRFKTENSPIDQQKSEPQRSEKFQQIKQQILKKRDVTIPVQAQAKMLGIEIPEEEIRTGTPEFKEVISGVVGKPEGFIEETQAAFAERGTQAEDVIERAVAGEQTIPESALQLSGTGAAFTVDVIGSAIKNVAQTLTPDILEEKLKDFGKNILETDLGQQALGALSKGLEAYEEFAKANPRVANDLEAILKISEGVPGIKVGKLALKSALDITGKVAKTKIGKLGVQKTKEFAKIGVELTKESLEPNEQKILNELNETVGRITQGEIKDRKTALKAFDDIDTKGVKTFEDLELKMDSAARPMVLAVDDELIKHSDKFPLAEFSVVAKANGKEVRTNFVGTALDHLEEVYEKINFPEDLVRIQAFKEKVLKEGLTLKNANDISREYRRNFEKKAFSVKGEQLTSVNARLFENVRSGVKKAVRDKMPDETIKELDRKMSNILNTKRLINKMTNQAAKLRQKAEKRGIVKKVARLAGRGVDVVTFGAPRAFLASFLPSNVGNKVLNSLGLQEELKKSLKKLRVLNKKIDSIPIEKRLKKKVEKLKASKVGEELLEK